MNLEPRTYYDEINDVVVHFHSDASQDYINAWEWAGEWREVKNCLLAQGCIVIEQNLN